MLIPEDTLAHTHVKRRVYRVERGERKIGQSFLFVPRSRGLPTTLNTRGLISRSLTPQGSIFFSRAQEGGGYHWARGRHHFCCWNRWRFKSRGTWIAMSHDKCFLMLHFKGKCSKSGGLTSTSVFTGQPTCPSPSSSILRTSTSPSLFFLFK